jgi:4-hydroxy-3-methylbut-2-enyl diphosphate reductase
MGQFDTSLGGRIYLVETPEDVDRLPVQDPSRLAFVTQTTLSVDDTARVVDALRRRFPALSGPRKEDICYATQNRQDAVKKLVDGCDVLIVVGSQTSSNSNRLRELAEKRGIPGYLVDGAAVVGVTAGASAPEVLVQQVVAQLREWGGQIVEELSGRPESVVFGLPRPLRDVAKARAAGT